MKIKSLNIEYSGELIMSDIDDCLMYSSMSLVRLKLNPTAFYFDNECYDQHKKEVFNGAQLSEWGKEFVELIKSGRLSDYRLITSAKNRMEILLKKFEVTDTTKIMENFSDEKKVAYLNSLKVPTIYVDDKDRVLDKVSNSMVKCIAYPISRRAPPLVF